MRGKILGFALALLSVATVGVVQLGANAAVDRDRDCDQFAVVYCGTMSPQEARNKYDQASRIFGHLGIKKSEIRGNFVNGVVYRDGRVVTDGGKVVATNARTAIRNMSGGNKIAGTNAAVYPTSRMGSAQSAMIKLDSNGRFLFAIMKPCGNPVVGPPTQPKPVAKCKNLLVDKLERTRFRFTAKAEAKHGANIRSYTYEVFHEGKRILNKTVKTAKYVYNAPEAGDYRVRVTVNTSEGPKSGPDCVKKFTVKVKPAVVCKNLRVAALSRTQFRFTANADATRAKISGYKFVVRDGGGTIVHTQTVSSTKEIARLTYNQSLTGNYTVRVTVLSNLAPVSGPNCVKPFEVRQLPPTATCDELALTKLSDNRYRLTAHATVTNGATIDGYEFAISRDGQLLDTIPVDSNTSPASTEYTATTEGTYEVVATVKTSLGDRSGPACEGSFVVPPTQNPIATCEDLSVATLSDTSFRFDARANAEGGATISGYEFVVTRGGQTVHTQLVPSTAETASLNYTETTPGDYQVKVTVKTSLGDRTGPACEATFSVTEEQENPNINITKLVEGVKYKQVGVNVEFTYQIRVTNTGDVDLEDVLVTDTPEQGITLISASAGTVADNKWTHTIPVLEAGEHMDFTLTAKVPEFLAGRLTNTVCVDAPEVPGNPDDCDTADVEVPKEGNIIVCVLETREIKQIKKSEFDREKHTTDLSKCEDAPVAPTPTELPTTGPAEVIAQLLGATSLTTAGSYYFASRRQ
jgi:uncharacterized repeat protein (TIGR01451 family)